MTPSHGVCHDREKGSRRLGYLPLASAIRVKQRELSLKRLGPCWDAPRSQEPCQRATTTANQAGAAARSVAQGVPHQRRRGLCHWHSMLPTAGVQLQFGMECRCGCLWSLDVLGRCKVRTCSIWHPRLWIGHGHLSSSANELGGCVPSIPQCSKEHARRLPLGQFLYFFVG